MITLKADQIKEIAELLDMGMKCFYNKNTEEIKYFPDFRSQEYVDREEWLDLIDEIDANFDEYIGFEPMSSHESFKVMELFIDEVDDATLKKRLYWALSRSHPFSNFKDEIDYNGAYRELWFTHKSQMNIQWVEEQLESYNK